MNIKDILVLYVLLHVPVAFSLLAFEGNQFISVDENFDEIEFESEVAHKANFYRNNNPDTEKRLISICENIIRNNGEFVL